MIASPMTGFKTINFDGRSTGGGGPTPIFSVPKRSIIWAIEVAGRSYSFSNPRQLVARSFYNGGGFKDEIFFNRESSNSDDDNISDSLRVVEAGTLISLVYTYQYADSFKGTIYYLEID